jgi:protein gp37
MGTQTTIGWTDRTFNPWIGCTKVSPGCKFCYAEVSPAARFMNIPWGPGKPRHLTADGNWMLPERWNKDARRKGIRLRVFCASLADVFDAEVNPTWRMDLWNLIARTPNLDWQLLTKRPENIPAMLPKDWETGWPNVWLGTSVENQETADLRIPLLLKVPARIRFLSCEPLLGPVDLPFTPTPFGNMEIHWVIIGGESGPHARHCQLDWVRSILEQSVHAGVPVFVKQLGSNQGDAAVPVRTLTFAGSEYILRDPKGEDPAEWPEWLRVQQFPEARP